MMSRPFVVVGMASSCLLRREQGDQLMLVREWEEHQRTSNRRSVLPRVSITRSRTLYLNEAAYSLLGRPSHVILLCDARNQVIGLRPASAGDAHSYRVRKQKASTSYVIGASAFIRYCGIDCSQVTVFEHITTEDGILLLALNHARRAGRRPPWR